MGVSRLSVFIGLVFKSGPESDRDEVARAQSPSEVLTMKTPRHKQAGFTLVEVLIVILILGLLLGIALPNMLRARTQSQSKACHENLRAVSVAKERWAMDNNIPPTGTPAWSDLVPIYLKGIQPSCPAGGDYTIGALDEEPSCSIGGEHSAE